MDQQGVQRLEGWMVSEVPCLLGGDLPGLVDGSRCWILSVCAGPPPPTPGPGTTSPLALPVLYLDR